MKRRIFVDKSELVLTVIGKKKAQVLNVPYDSVKSIRFEPDKAFKLYKFVPSERIVIEVSSRLDPVIYRKANEKKFFDTYKKELEEFVKRHHITFHNTVTGTDQG
jgi:hypothetical protein